MATDPVRQIRQHRRESPFATNLPAALTRLAALEPSIEPPYLTVGLDLRPEGMRPGRRPGREYVDQNAEEFLAGFEAHTPAHDSLSADLDRLKAYLDDELDPTVQGLVVVACSAKNVFEALPLGLPVPDRITTGPTPSLLAIARVAEDEPPYAVLLADQQQSSLLVIDRADREQSVEIEGTDSPNKHAQNSASRRRDQNRADEQIESFARSAAEEARAAMDGTGIKILVLAGDESTTTMLRAALHETIRERVVGDVRLDVTVGERELIDATMPIVERSEREREAEAVGRIRNGAGPGGGAVAGPVETMTALQTGQVMTLVMNDDFADPGWADFTFPVYGAGDPPAEHPAGGDAANIVSVPLEDELVRLALQTGAEIEIVRTSVPVGAEEQADVPDAGEGTPRSAPARELDALGGVGALLRFALDDDRSTANL